MLYNIIPTISLLAAKCMYKCNDLNNCDYRYVSLYVFIKTHGKNVRGK